MKDTISFICIYICICNIVFNWMELFKFMGHAWLMLERSRNVRGLFYVMLGVMLKCSRNVRGLSYVMFERSRNVRGLVYVMLGFMFERSSNVRGLSYVMLGMMLECSRVGLCYAGVHV